MANNDVKVNRKYKDRLFLLIFGNEKHKENILSLYNALHNTNYSDVDDIEITTLEDVIYIKMKNDVSFLIDSYLTLWEQQSSYNPNMPLRGLLYYGELYDKYIAQNGLNIYSSTPVKIPNPRYIVLFNGTAKRPAIEEMKLSDLFLCEDKSGNFEWTAMAYNLNKGNNEDLLKKCEPLSDYMKLVERIRINQESGESITQAVDSAVKSCINDGVMSDLLTELRAEVMDVCITEFNEKVYVDSIRAEGENKLASLIQMLLSVGRSDEIAKATSDNQYKESLYKEFNITD